MTTIQKFVGNEASVEEIFEAAYLNSLFFSVNSQDELVGCTLLERMGRKGLSSHAIARAGFSTWARERTSADHNVIELSLAHRIGDAVMRAYARSDLMAKRRALMQEWAAFLWSAS